MHRKADLTPAADRKAFPLSAPPLLLRSQLLLRVLWGMLAVLLLLVAAAWGWRWYRLSSPAAELPVYGAVGDLALTERSGQPFQLAALKDRVWIVTFFFTNCTMICPRTMPQMARLQEALAESADARLVAITVDPAYDTPAVLAEFAQRFGAQPERWYFLTGDQQAIYDLSLNTFHLAVEALPDGQHQHSGDAFLHAGHFALVDRQAQIRGYYDALDDEAMARLLQDASLLLQEKSGY